MPSSPSSIKRSSVPPFPAAVSQSQSYKASPLGRALTPPPALTGPSPFYQDARTSLHSAHTSSSGQNFHIPSSGLSSSESATSPTFYSSQHMSSNSQSSNNSAAPVQIVCFQCRRPCVVADSFACTSCIRGYCNSCVYLLSSDHSGGPLQTGTLGLGRGRPCPGCGMLGGSYKSFQLEFR